MIVTAYAITVVAVFALSPLRSTCTATGRRVRTARPNSDGMTRIARTSLRSIRVAAPLAATKSKYPELTNAATSDRLSAERSRSSTARRTWRMSQLSAYPYNSRKNAGTTSSMNSVRGSRTICRNSLRLTATPLRMGGARAFRDVEEHVFGRRLEGGDCGDRHARPLEPRLQLRGGLPRVGRHDRMHCGAE